MKTITKSEQLLELSEGAVIKAVFTAEERGSMTTIDHQQAAIWAIAAALHGDACPADPDPGESCGCGDYEREAEIALAAALPIIKQAVQEARAEEIRDLVSDKPENPYMYNPWDDSSIDPTNLDEVVGAAVSCGWGSGYYEGVQAVLALLEGGGACCEHSKCPGGSICCCQEGGGEDK